MPTEWQHTVHVVCVANAMPGAIAALDIAFPCDNGAARNPSTPEQYGCRLSADGKTPVTHYGAIFSVTEEIRQQLEGLGLHQAPGVSYWRTSNPDGILHASNWPNQQIGAVWSFEDALAAVGLKRIEDSTQ